MQSTSIIYRALCAEYGDLKLALKSSFLLLCNSVAWGPLVLVLGSATMGIYCMGLVFIIFFSHYVTLYTRTHARGPALTWCLCAHCVCVLFVTVTDFYISVFTVLMKFWQILRSLFSCLFTKRKQSD